MTEASYQIQSQKQKDYYNQTAKHYDQWHVDTGSAAVVDAWNFSNLKKFLGKNKIDTCLDIACGTGRLSNNLLQIAREVYGVDQSQAVLDIAQAKYPQLKLACAEVVDLPYADNFFDLVLINGSLHHFFAVKKTLTEAKRVLKPGGYFVLLGEPSSLYHKIYNPFFYIWLVDRAINKIFSLVKKSPASSEIEPEAEAYHPPQLKQQFLDSGFIVRQFYTYDFFPRHESRICLKIYRWYLPYEHKILAKICPFLGSAIQIFAQKPKNA
ncbi:MAG: methyltransferase domain-containing protein [Patescibacteria group bacterium]